MNDLKYIVYKHTNIQNNKVYIGITCQKAEDRWGRNGINYKSSPYFYNAICKYGWDNFTHEVLYDKLSKQDACALEIKLIQQYKSNTKDYGYNILEGGQSPSIPEEIRNVLSEKLKGNKNGLGKPCSEEKKLKISLSQKGRKLTEEHKQKISLSKLGKSHESPSEETRKKISNSHTKKRIYCVETNIEYDSIQDCAKQTGFPATTICAICKGRVKSYKKYHFKYKE